MAKRVEQIAQILDRRQPPSSSGWDQRRAWRFEGPKIYLVVDDLDSIPLRQQVHEQVAAGGLPPPNSGRMVTTWEPLLRHFGNAVDRGLRVVVTHRAADISTAEIHVTGIPHQLATHPSTRILLGSRSDRDKVGGVKFEVGLPPGAATSSPATMTTVGMFSWLQHQAECNRHVKRACEGCCGTVRSCCNDSRVSFAGRRRYLLQSSGIAVAGRQASPERRQQKARSKSGRGDAIPCNST